MRLSNLTNGAEQAMARSREIASSLGQHLVGSEHLLLSLLRDEGAASSVLGAFGVRYGSVMAALSRTDGELASQHVGYLGLSYTPNATHVLEHAKRHAEEIRSILISTEQILWGILDVEECLAFQILSTMGVDMHQLRRILEEDSLAAVSAIRSSGISEDEGSSFGTLEEFGTDLTERAAKGELDEVIGRKDDMRQLMQILGRRRKNNPLILGDPGVGKSALVEGLADLIVVGKVPSYLKGVRIITLDLGSIVSGSKYRGDFERRMRGCIQEAMRAGNVILFIDEIHSVIGAGAGEGSVDAGSILKPPLSRGDIQVIGATTIDEYRKRFTNDPALERRFQPLTIEEPDSDETLLILDGLKERYESFHGVSYTSEALESAVGLSGRYLSGRHQPDKAIDVMDAAGARLCYESTMGEAGETGLASEGAVVVDKHLVAEIVSEASGVPVSRLTEEQSKRLLKMEEALERRVVGQDEAVSVVSKTIRRVRAGLSDPRRPGGSFLFLGPTGVGKTELAKALAEFLFGSEGSLITFDMSEYMEKFAVSRLIGAPPGYVGYDEGGQLTKAVRLHPYSVILFDEMEKAHPDVFNILLQVLEEGRLTDGQGRKVNFRNAIVIMTSNVGARDIMRDRTVGFMPTTEEADALAVRKDVTSSLSRMFRPEFLNRIDRQVIFNRITGENGIKIVDLMLGDLLERLGGRGLGIEVTPEAKGLLAKEGIDEKYGARSLRRVIQQRLEDPISEGILRGDWDDGDVIHVDCEDDGLQIS